MACPTLPNSSLKGSPDPAAEAAPRGSGGRPPGRTQRRRPRGGSVSFRTGGAKADPSAGQDLVEEGFGLVLVGLLGQRELTDQYLPGLGEHPLLACRQAAFLVATPQVPHDLGNLVDVTG